MMSRNRPHRFTDSPVLKIRMSAWRWRVVLLALLLGFLAVLARAFYIQVINNDFLQKKGESRYLRDLEVPALRGKILDRNGNALAVSTPMKSVWAIPSEARLTEEQKKTLARLIDVDVKEVVRRLGSDKGFVYLQRQVSPDVADRVAAQKFPGIFFDTEYRRYYPAGEMVSHIVGFTGLDDKGLEGVELAFQSQLAGKAGSRRVIKDRRGQIVEDVVAVQPPQDGQDVYLALDSKLQYIAFSALKQAVTEHRAKAGGVVVLDARTGEILALSNWPTYNPNNRSGLSGAQLRNRAVTDIYEPGSTMKPFTAALGMEKGKFRPDTVINCAPGKMTIGKATISDAHPHGALTLEQVIQKSSNIGTTKVALSLPSEDMWAMFDRLGFGKTPRLGFPGEAGGRLRPWKKWLPIEQATMSYGHGISVSLIQIARAYLIFARSGDLPPLSLIRTEGNTVQGAELISKKVALDVRKMLEMAAGPGGTATKAQIAGYRVAGKTGTAHKLEKGVYANKYVASFVGLAPVTDPRLVVAVMIDEPSAGKHYGGDVAAPVFASVVSGSLWTLGVPADESYRPVVEEGLSD